MRQLTLAAGLVLLTACPGRGIEYEGGPGGEGGDDTAPIEVSECGADLDLTTGINIKGIGLDVGTGELLTWGEDTGSTALCVSAIDPTPAVTGGVPTTLVASTMCEDGSFVLAGIDEIPAIGIMVQIEDCDGEGTVMRSVSGVAADQFEGFGPGDTLEGVVARSLDVATRDAWHTELDGYGYGHDLGADGFLAGYVLDSAEAEVSGAQVTCGGCSDRPTWYADGDASDGVFATGANANTSSNAAGDSFFIIPAARITTYTCSDASHDWEGTLLGSLEGYGVFIRFIAN